MLIPPCNLVIKLNRGRRDEFNMYLLGFLIFNGGVGLKVVMLGLACPLEREIVRNLVDVLIFQWY